MALILKSELEKDEQYQSFVKKCHQCRQEIQQTELLFLCRLVNGQNLVILT